MSVFQDIAGIELFLVLLPIISLLYASVGHGGASGYLALMSLWSFPMSMMKPTALLLNIFVAAISFIAYARLGYFRMRLFLAFALGSIPMAFIGGGMDVDTELYKRILGVLLIFAIWKMFKMPAKRRQLGEVNFLLAVFFGGAIGFFSGLIGIGGGIILTPLILILGWGDMKEAAAVSAIFIWVNSVAALSGYVGSGNQWNSGILLMAAIAFVGGLIGAYLGSTRFDNALLRKLLAVVLLIASIKLIFV